MAQTLACYTACTALQMGADTEAHGAFPSVIQAVMHGLPYVAGGLRVGGRAGGWAGALVLTMQVRLAGLAWNPTES